MRISVIASLIVAVHVGVVLMVTAPGCTTVKREPPVAPGVVQQPSQPATTMPDIPPMPPMVEPTPVPPAEVLPPVTARIDVPETPAVDNIYVVQSGDSISKIAVRHGVKAADIIDLNGIKDPNKIIVGQKLLLPAYATPSQSKPVPAKAGAAAPAKAEKTADGQTVHVVKNGDALSKIAKAYGVKQSAIIEANGIKDPNKINIGTKLVIPAAGAAAPAKAEKKEEKKAEDAVPAPAAPAADAAPAEEITPVEELPEIAAPAGAEAATPGDGSFPYNVGEGETLESIERVFMIEKGSLARYNGLAPDAALKPNQVLRIPPPSAP